jgi:hypothetical protein
MVRTTLNLDDDVLRAARSLADEEGLSLGSVVSELLRRALAPDPHTRYRDGFPVFRVSEGAPPITPEMVERALSDE